MAQDIKARGGLIVQKYLQSTNYFYNYILLSVKLMIKLSKKPDGLFKCIMINKEYFKVFFLVTKYHFIFSVLEKYSILLSKLELSSLEFINNLFHPTRFWVIKIFYFRIFAGFVVRHDTSVNADTKFQFLLGVVTDADTFFKAGYFC